jgi:hypothetical protein
MARVRKNILVAGMIEQGKTTMIIQLCEAIHAKTKGPHKVLYLISSDPIPAQNIERLKNYNELGNFCNQDRGIAKFFDYEDKYRPLDKALEFLSKYYKNGILVIEDATPIMQGNLSIPVRDTYTNHKNRGVDIITAYHSLIVPPYLCNKVGFTDIFIFKTLGKYKPDYIQNAFAKEMSERFPLVADEIVEAVTKVEKAAPVKAYIQPYQRIITGL